MKELERSGNMSQYKLAPVEPNKAALIGEFKFKITETCPQCFYEEPREDCEICEGANSYQREITVPWDTTKEMYRAMLEAAPVVNTPNQPGLIDELAEALLVVECAKWLAKGDYSVLGGLRMIDTRDFSILRDAVAKYEYNIAKGGAL